MTEDYDEEVIAQEVSRIRRRGRGIALVIIVAGLVAAGLIALGLSGLTRTVDGVPVVNAAEVSRYADEVKAAEEAAAADAERAYIASLETQVQQEILNYFTEPGHALPWKVYVHGVSLIRTGPTTFTGMANMQLEGYSIHQVEVTVTADDRNVMWNIPAGAMMVLLDG